LHLLPTLSMTSCARRRSGWKAGTCLLCQKRVLRQRWRIIRILCSNLLHSHCLAGGLSRLHNNSYVHAACRLTSAVNYRSPSQLHELCWRAPNALWTMPRIWSHLVSSMAEFRVLGVELPPSSSVGNHVLDHRQQVTLSLLKPSHYRRAQQRRGCAHRATVAHGQTCMHGCSACTRTIHYSFFLPMHHDAKSGHHDSVRAGRLSLNMASSNACCHLLQMVGTHLQRLTSTWHCVATILKCEELRTRSPSG